MLLTSALEQLYAQSSQANPEKTFELPPDNIKRRFIIDLDKGNKMLVELTDIDQLDHLKNIDSILKVFVKDMEPLKDSLGAELLSRRIDYLMDSSAVRKIRIQRSQPAGSNFMVSGDELSSLKLSQDTISITGKVMGTVSLPFFRERPGYNYYRVSFFLNDLEDLSGYMDGQLNEKINELQQNINSNWVGERGGGVHMKKAPYISAPAARGYAGGSDYLTLRVSVDAQNYKSYFVPSVSLGFAILTHNNFVKREYGLGTEHHFLFAKNSEGKLETTRNSFLTLSYGQSSLKNGESRSNTNLYPFLSVGYLIKKRGDFYDKNTFKVGVGRFSLFGGSTKIEPTFYFNNLFKGVTPSLRITQNF